MKRKSFVSLILCFCLFGMTGCGPTDDGGSQKPSQDVKVVDIMMTSAGYGRAWIDGVIEAFNSYYEEDGYKANLLEPRAGFQGSSALSEIRLGTETGYDLVIAPGVSVYQVTDASYGVFAENLNDLYDTGVIEFDGTVSEIPLKSKVSEKLETNLKIGDNYYGFPVTASRRGYVANTKVLEKYGITKLPRTTNEMFSAAETILGGATVNNINVPGMMPFTWGGSNAYGYALPTLYLSLAQLMGQDNYDKFYKLDYLLDAEGKIDKNGYEFINDDAFLPALHNVIRSFDPIYSVPGSITQTHNQAHAQLITGKAAFMFDGEFFFNEVRANFSSRLHDIDMLRVPIMSELGTRLMLDGTGSDKAKCDAILSYMALVIDEGDTDVNSIKTKTETEFSGITLTTDQVSRVYEARTTDYGETTNAYIIKDSPSKDVAKLFLRFLSSDDAAAVYAKSGMFSAFGTADYSKVEHQFIKSAAKLYPNSTMLISSTPIPGTVRAKTNMFLIPPYNALLPVTLADEIGIEEANKRDYDALTLQTYNKIKNNVTTNWKSLIGTGGYELAN